MSINFPAPSSRLPLMLLTIARPFSSTTFTWNPAEYTPAGRITLNVFAEPAGSVF